MKFKEKLNTFTARFKTMNPSTKKKLYIAAATIGLANLALSLFSVYTLLSFALFVIGVLAYTKFSWDNLMKEGFLKYLPKKLVKTLMHRSIFDVLCDIWFIPKISIYIKAMAMPFLCEIKPDEAIHQLDELHPSVRKAVLTKGVINLLPESVQQALVPKQETKEISEDEKQSSDDEHSFTSVIAEATSPSKRQALNAAVIISADSTPTNETQLIKLNDKETDSQGSNREKWSTDDEPIPNRQGFNAKNVLPSFLDMNLLRSKLEAYPFKEVFLQ
jgi:hypothetical protein